MIVVVYCDIDVLVCLSIKEAVSLHRQNERPSDKQ